MKEMELYNVYVFLRHCDDDYSKGILQESSLEEAYKYLKEVKALNDVKKSAFGSAIEDKLNFVIKQMSLEFSKKKKKVYSKKSEELELLNLLPTKSISDFIIKSIKEKRLTDPELIARYAYIQLSRNVYYNISYTKVSKEDKVAIVNDYIDVKKANIFSYVVCTQWLALYSYILSNFGLKVNKMSRDNSDHVWGEVNLHNGKKIIVDATEYIGKSIDLSNAKSMSPTKGFLIVPEEYSNIRLFDLYFNDEYKNEKDLLFPYYEENRDLDISLGFIDNYGYPIEIILKENELFQDCYKKITDVKQKEKYINNVKRFLIDLPIPGNMDGYEVFAYYHMLIKKLPKFIQPNISLKTLYANTNIYKQRKLRQKYLEAPSEYLIYLQKLMYDRYYEYLQEGKDNNEILSKIKKGVITGEELSKELLKQEIKISQINKRLNPYYAINELKVFNTYSEDYDATYAYYEPSSGETVFKNSEDAMNYKKLNKILE